MKKVKFYFMAIVAILFCSCSSEYYNEPVVPVGEVLSASRQGYEAMDEDCAFEAFMQSVDSLNDAYSEGLEPLSRGVGGRIGKEVAIAAADAVGAKAGQFGGKWLGSVVCAGSGNPVVVAIGYYGGRKVGGLVGYAVASALTRYILEKDGMESTIVNNAMQFDADCSLKPSVIHRQQALMDPTLYYDVTGNFGNTQADSIGYLHNMLMVELDANRSLFIKEGEVDHDKLYETLIDLLLRRNIVPFEFFYVKDIKRGFIDLARSAFTISAQALSKDYPLVQITGTQQSMLKNKYKLEVNEYRNYSRVNNSVLGQCCKMTRPQIKAYAGDLNEIILNSALSLDDKEEIMYLSQFAVNSAICWTNN